MTKLLQQLQNYDSSIDIPCIMDRFVGDEQLYEMCFNMFLTDEGFIDLQEAISTHNTDAAFHIAHTLKGVAANLGLTPLYNKICVLVESLRLHNDSDANKQYADISAEKLRMGMLVG